jgi:hypothetical protein
MPRIEVIHPKRLFGAYPLFGAQTRTIHHNDPSALDIVDTRLSDESFSITGHCYLPDEYPSELPARPSSTWPDNDDVKNLSSFPGYVPLITRRIGFVHDRREHSSLPPAHLVIGPLGSPGAMMGIGMKVDTGDMKGKLTRVFDSVDEGVRFVCEQDNSDFPFVLLQVDHEYAILPPGWRIKSAIRRGQEKIRKWWRKN